jgi:hypothetical protein
VLSDGITLAASASLTLSPGMVVEMDQGAYLYVQGTLKAQGTAAAPITFTSALPQPKPGDWWFLQLDGSTASGSVLDHVQLLYGSASGAAAGMLSLTGGASPAITHCLVANSSQIGIFVGSGHPTIAFCAFRDDGGPAISLPASDPQHVHDNTFAPGQQGMVIR